MSHDTHTIRIVLRRWLASLRRCRKLSPQAAEMIAYYKMRIHEIWESR
jgi:hypothetical protein